MSEMGDNDSVDRMHLARLVQAEIDRRRGLPEHAKDKRLGDATFLATYAIDPATGEPGMVRQTADNILHEPRDGFVAPRSIRAIASFCHLPDHAIYIANAVSVGLSVPTGDDGKAVSAWARTIWPAMDDAPEGFKAAHRDTIYWGLRAMGLVE